MDTITKNNTSIEKFATGFESLKPALFGDMKIREAAMESFYKQGIPGRKHEEYKYVNMELSLKGDFTFSPKSTISSVEQFRIIKDAVVVAIVNGKYSKELSDSSPNIKGFQISDIADTHSNAAFLIHYSKYTDVNADPFIALNTAMATGGVFIHLAKNLLLERPVHIIHITSSSENAIVQSRNLIVLEENSEASIVESFVTLNSSAKVFNNALTEIYVDANARLTHNKVQDEQEFGYLVNTTQAVQKKQSVLTTNNFTLSGSLVRNNLNLVLDDEHIETHLNGLYLTKGNQSVDNHTLVDHRKPNCNSNELYKGIIEEKSTATFNGKIYVRKDAQKTNAFQSNKNILLSDDGTINTKPQLEIYADDVKCSHGTSTGKLDEDKIFYLRARGLSEASAKKLLMHAFASEVVEHVRSEELRNYIEEKITERFA
jgi:Fe-S cluster assembly protein SufD